MELPKNITQIGETNPYCKIYVEDYVISYIKQLNQFAGEKEMAVAVYGIKKEEAGITYLFLYGACKLTFLQKECRHLSQAVQQEAERQRKRFFEAYLFLGYRILNGEMVEGFHICEQNVCRYVEGYAQFYEKNDAMLAFMLEERQEAVKPEVFDQEKYNVVKKRQEERRAQAGEKGGHAFRTKDMPSAEPEAAPVNSGRGNSNGRLRNMKMTAAAAFAVLCVAGLATMENGGKLGEWQMAIRQLVEDVSQKQLPDVVEVSNGSAQVGTIVAEDKLTDAILQENATAESMPDSGQEEQQESVQGSDASQEPAQDAPESPTQGSDASQEPVQNTPEPPAQGSDATPEPAQDAAEPPAQGNDASQEPAQNAPESPAQGSDASQEPEKGQEAEAAAGPTVELVSYIVKRGDTLTNICIRTYGSDARVSEICSLNNISDPDDIKEGEKIFLPQ